MMYEYGESIQLPEMSTAPETMAYTILITVHAKLALARRDCLRSCLTSSFRAAASSGVSARGGAPKSGSMS